MNLKVIGSMLLVVGVTAGLLFAINANKESISLVKTGPVKSEAYLRCEALVNDIQEEASCEKKWEKFNAEFKDCESFPPSEPTETEINSSTFRDIIFNMADCYSGENKMADVLKVYDRGLQFQDWMKDDHFNSYSAHFLMNRGKQLSQDSKNPKCFNEKSFGTQIQKFLNSKNPEDFKELLYSEDSLDTQVMASDAGGYLSYAQWKEVFEDGKDTYDLKFSKKVDPNCYLTTGWDKDYPWRAFCAEKRGSKGCYYLMTIYAGIEATMADFEEFKKQSADGTNKRY